MCRGWRSLTNPSRAECCCTAEQSKLVVRWRGALSHILMSGLQRRGDTHTARKTHKTHTHTPPFPIYHLHTLSPCLSTFFSLTSSLTLVSVLVCQRGGCEFFLTPLLPPEHSTPLHHLMSNTQEITPHPPTPTHTQEIAPPHTHTHTTPYPPHTLEIVVQENICWSSMIIS